MTKENNVEKRPKARIPHHLIEEFQREGFSISRRNPSDGQAPIRGYRPRPEGAQHSPDRKFGVR